MDGDNPDVNWKVLARQKAPLSDSKDVWCSVLWCVGGGDDPKAGIGCACDRRGERRSSRRVRPSVVHIQYVEVRS